MRWVGGGEERETERERGRERERERKKEKFTAHVTYLFEIPQWKRWLLFPWCLHDSVAEWVKANTASEKRARVRCFPLNSVDTEDRLPQTPSLTLGCPSGRQNQAEARFEPEEGRSLRTGRVLAHSLLAGKSGSQWNVVFTETTGYREGAKRRNKGFIMTVSVAETAAFEYEEARLSSQLFFWVTLKASE